MDGTQEDVVLCMTRRAMEDPKSIQRRFEAAVKVIRNLPEDGSYDLSDDMLVIFYSYYKQATAGPCNTPKPNFWDPIGKAKWEAWKTLGNMSKDQAMMEYVQEIQLIIETLPVTDRMAELMDALDPFYEMAEDDDDDDDDDEDEAISKTAPLSTGNTYAEKTDDDAAEKVEEGEGEINGESKEDDMEMEERRKDSSTFAAGRGGLSVFNGSEENSTSSSADDAHSSLNTEEEEEELAHDDSDDEMYGDSMENPAAQEKGSGVPRVHLADVSVAGAHMQQEGNREPRCGSQDGKPQGATPPVPHPPTLGPVRTDRISAGSGRGHQLTGSNLPDEHDNLSAHSCQGNGQCWETEERADKQAFNPQIAVILSQLQDNMQDVLHRLTTLELLAASQAEILPLKARHSKSPKKVALVAFKLVPYHCSADGYLALRCALAGAVFLAEKEEMVKSEVKIQVQLRSS